MNDIAAGQKRLRNGTILQRARQYSRSMTPSASRLGTPKARRQGTEDTLTRMEHVLSCTPSDPKAPVSPAMSDTGNQARYLESHGSKGLKAATSRTDHKIYEIYEI